MDQLDSKAQDVLYTIFEWPYLPKSRLCLIGKVATSSEDTCWESAVVSPGRHSPPSSSGIANALDLTDRILPRLQARPQCRPQLLNFPPYTRQELVAIVQDRLAQVRNSGRADEIDTLAAVSLLDVKANDSNFLTACPDYMFFVALHARFPL